MGRIIEINWIYHPSLPQKGKFGLTRHPGKKNKRRRLLVDLGALKNAGVSHIYCLLEYEEMVSLDLAQLPDLAGAMGIAFTHAPIEDFDIPSFTRAKGLAAGILEDLREARRVIVHCRLGLGRSGTVAACVLVMSGVPPERAIQSVRDQRSRLAIDPKRQERFIFDFAAQLGADEEQEEIDAMVLGLDS